MNGTTPRRGRGHPGDRPSPIVEPGPSATEVRGPAPVEAGGRPFSGLVDSFEDKAAPGTVVGSTGSGGALRWGVDAEGVLGVDHGALRIGQVDRAGWGRHGIAYGPYARTAGLGFVAVILNGHNASQTRPPVDRTWTERLHRTAARLAAHLIPSRVPPNPRPPACESVERESLAFGWFAHAVPSSPTRRGHRLFVRSAGPRNGDLHAGVGVQSPRAMRSVPNVPLVLAAVLRERGAIYYGGYADTDDPAGALPPLRPLAVSAEEIGSPVFAGFCQNVLGEIGFSVDTRVYGVEIRRLPGFDGRFGGAHVADGFSEQRSVDSPSAPSGEGWHLARGHRTLSPRGLVLSGTDPLLVADPGERSGLVRARLASGASRGRAGLVWRYRSPERFWRIGCSDGRLRVVRVEEGRPRVARQVELPGEVGDGRDLQLVDRRKEVDVIVDGAEVISELPVPAPVPGATGVGLTVTGGEAEAAFEAFEAHPDAMHLGEGLELDSPWRIHGTESVLIDEFRGTEGPLEARSTPSGASWRRELGRGRIRLDGSGGARVRASRSNPNPGRTAYTTDWPHPEFAEIRARIVPPGTRRGDDERGRGGVIFARDPDTYLIVNNWFNDSYGGASVSSFLRYEGREDLFRAVWTNVGDRIRRGVPYELRVAFDGECYTVWIDGHPVLFRSVHDLYPEASPFRIHRVGLAVNWEWGNDTGTVFRRFEAHTCARDHV